MLSTKTCSHSYYYKIIRQRWDIIISEIDVWFISKCAIKPVETLSYYYVHVVYTHKMRKKNNSFI